MKFVYEYLHRCAIERTQQRRMLTIEEEEKNNLRADCGINNFPLVVQGVCNYVLEFLYFNRMIEISEKFMHESIAS